MTTKRASRFTREDFIAVCCAIATMSIIVSNIIVNKQFDFFGFALPAAVMLIPVDYIIGDVVAEVFGFRAASHVIILAFLMNTFAVMFYLIAIALPSYPTFTAQASFEAVLGTTPRILFASLSAFAAGSLLNAKVMQVMHKRDGEARLAWRCILSTLVGEGLDTAMFALLAFVGVVPWDVIGQMIILHTIAKVTIETVLYALATRHIIRWAKTLS